MGATQKGENERPLSLRSPWARTAAGHAGAVSRARWAGEARSSKGVRGTLGTGEIHLDFTTRGWGEQALSRTMMDVYVAGRPTGRRGSGRA